jgi:ABC-type Mn2+/Zn2+ transport system permease subunit
MITAAVAMGSIGGLVGLTVSGLLTRLPGWAAVLIVVSELLLPVLVFLLLKRQEDRR